MSPAVGIARPGPVGPAGRVVKRGRHLTCGETALRRRRDDLRVAIRRILQAAPSRADGAKPCPWQGAGRRAPAPTGRLWCGRRPPPRPPVARPHAARGTLPEAAAAASWDGMEWRAEGTLLAVRQHGESAAIIEVLTEAHGRHLGVVPGGAGRRLTPVLQPGADLDCTWRARLETQLGTFTVEPLKNRAAALMSEPTELAALATVCALLSVALPERAPYPALCRASRTLLDLIGSAPDWPAAYLRWELGLLEQMGYGLDLTSCAVTGARTGLVHVSPRTGRAVSAAGAGHWADRLLPLPACLTGAAPAEGDGLLAALAVTGHFLDRHLVPGDRGLPPARARLLARLAGRPTPPPG